MLRSGEESQPQEDQPAPISHEDAALEVTLLHAVQHHQIQTVLEALQRGAHGAVLVYVTGGRASARVDLAARGRGGDLTLGEDTHEAPRALSLLECTHLGAYDALDEATQREAVATIVGVSRRSGG